MSSSTEVTISDIMNKQGNRGDLILSLLKLNICIINVVFPSRRTTILISFVNQIQFIINNIIKIKFRVALYI